VSAGVAALKILFVAPRFPDPPTQGDRLRAYELLRRLSGQHEIVLVAPDQPRAASIARQLGVEWVPVALRRFEPLVAPLRALANGLPLQVPLLCPPAMITAVRQLLSTRRFDLIHLHTARVGPIAAQATIPVVTDFIDALSLNMHRRAAREQMPRRWVFAWEAQRMARYEQQLLRQSAAACVVAPADAQVLGQTVQVIPMGVDRQRFVADDTPRDPATLILSGRMAYFPNADAAHYLAHDILPLVHASRPDVRLRIVGADPPSAVQSLAILPGVEVVGHVADMAAELRRATIAVAPLRSGTGIQMKVLEAMACGTAVVATPLALAGIAAQPQQHALVGAEPAELAAAIVQLLDQPHLRARLAAAAQQLVRQHYDWDQITMVIEQLYRDVVLRRNGAPHATNPWRSEAI
jgi:sugar transferase (PEP-CTERM/EpsH1 system associated)